MSGTTDMSGREKQGGESGSVLIMAIALLVPVLLAVAAFASLVN